MINGLIGGRLKSDPSFSNTLVWNNFPLPAVSKELRDSIIECGQKVIEVRNSLGKLSLAELYNPLSMNVSLSKAHEKLDKYVDSAFSAGSKISKNEERESLLFESYLSLSDSINF